MATEQLRNTLRAALIAATVILAGCEKIPQATESSSNPQFPVNLLFEHDGVRVYSFQNNGRTIYYTDARGSTAWSVTRSSGKTTTTNHYQVPTVE